jgi:methylenetetrahydrofolate reductase (NADPH)
MAFGEVLASGKFIVTNEFLPPKGIDLDPVLDEAEKLKGLVDAFTVTDNQSAMMKLDVLVACHRLQDRGCPPILQLSCRDRNRMALQSALLGAAHLGITDVLCLTGDHIVLGDHHEALPVFDIDSVVLVGIARKLEAGRDWADNELEGPPPRFCVGAVATPGTPHVEPQILKLEKKVRAGAEFVMTQAIYDMEALERFMEATAHLNVPIIAGICILKSEKNCQYFNKNIAGVTVPDAIIQRFARCDSKEARLECSTEVSAELIQSIRKLCRGVHLMPLGWDRHVPAILAAAGIDRAEPVAAS